MINKVYSLISCQWVGCCILSIKSWGNNKEFTDYGQENSHSLRNTPTPTLYNSNLMEVAVVLGMSGSLLSLERKNFRSVNLEIWEGCLHQLIVKSLRGECNNVRGEREIGWAILKGDNSRRVMKACGERGWLMAVMVDEASMHGGWWGWCCVFPWWIAGKRVEKPINTYRAILILNIPGWCDKSFLP